MDSVDKLRYPVGPMERPKTPLDRSTRDQYIAACQIGITVSSLVLGAYSQATIAVWITPLFEVLAGLQPLAAQPAAPVAGGEPDFIVVNARVLTSDTSVPRAEAFAVKHGRFTAVGSTSDIRNLATSRTQVVDAQRTEADLTRIAGRVRQHRISVVLNLEGLWVRYEEPEPLLSEIAELDERKATSRMQQIYAEPIKEELIGRRIEQVKDAGLPVAAALSPQRTARYYKAVVDAGVDLFVIRGTTVSAEHVSGRAEPLNLKQFIYELDVPVVVGGCATYQAALHLMRTGAAGVLVGFGGGSAHTTRDVLGVTVPMASAVAGFRMIRTGATRRVRSGIVLKVFSIMAPS